MIEPADLMNPGVGMIFELGQHRMEELVFGNPGLELNIMPASEQHDRRRVGGGDRSGHIRRSRFCLPARVLS